MTMQSVNPADGTVLESFSTHDAAHVAAALDTAHAAFLRWRERPFAERSVRMLEAAAVLRANLRRYAEAMTLEMGKPIGQSESEIEKCAWVCEYYARHAERFLSVEPVQTDASRSYVRYDPLGVVLAVMPWNFPFWQVFRFAAPALMAGNTGVLKHASNVPRCALMIEEVFREAGFPEGCFTTLLIGAGAVAEVIADRRVVAVTLTGSEGAGATVAEAAGRHLKKTVLELGGSDPFIVLRGASLPDAAITAAVARLINTGQSCIAAKRFIVEEAVADEFERLFVDAVQRKVVGDPMDPATDVGPLARPDLVDDLERQVQASVAAGARVLCGASRIDRPGAWYAPTVLTDVRPGMPVYHEEVFGPVAAVIRVRDAEEALHVANDSPYGLGAAVWSQDVAKAEQLAARIESGCVFINGMVKSDPRLPFGGVKLSGYGRELSSVGIREFVNIKSVWIR